MSRYGLLGGKASLTRDWGKYFRTHGHRATTTVNRPAAQLRDPGDPSVYTFMVGPELHANLYGNLSGLVFARAGRRAHRAARA